MPVVVLFGATGYTGQLTAEALHRRGIDFAVAGRNPEKLEKLAESTGASDVRIADAGDTAALVTALRDARVLITCVGPFGRWGDAAVAAALDAGVHYIDSTGEGAFVARLFERDADARSAGIAMAPSMGFDEVPADLAAALAAEGMKGADLTLTYAVPRAGSNGTIRTILTSIAGAPGRVVVDGRPAARRAGAGTRWAPMPPPLGPRRSVFFPTCEAHLAPRHLDLRNFATYLTVDEVTRILMPLGSRAVRLAMSVPGAEAVVDRVLPSGRGPGERARRGRWTLLAEASDGKTWRNVALTGEDVYGLTAETLAAGAGVMAAGDYRERGVLTPVQAFGTDVLHKELIDFGVDTQIYEPGA